MSWLRYNMIYNIFNVWDLKDPKLMAQGLLFKSQLTPEDIKYKEAAGKLSRTERQWLQIEKERDKDTSEFIDIEGLRVEMATWVYPYHFIDFETSAVAIPFHKNRTPYEGIAFQYSYHILNKDGSIEHKNQFLSTDNSFPNYQFLESLMNDLDGKEGTIFRYHNHENSFLNTSQKLSRSTSGKKTSPSGEESTSVK